MPSESQRWCKLLGVSQDASAREVCSAFEPLAHALAPIDLGGRAFYAVPATSLPEEFAGVSRGCAGWTGSWLYGAIRHLLPDDRGAGPVVVLAEDEEGRAELAARGAQAYYAARGEIVSLEELRSYYQPTGIAGWLGTLVHELAHAIESLADGSFADDHDLHNEWTGAIQMQRLARRRETEVAALGNADPQIPLHQHSFVRTVAHLDYRLREIDIMSTHLCVAGERYQMQPYADCYRALGSEMRNHRAVSFAEILALPIPPAFAACSSHTTGA